MQSTTNYGLNIVEGTDIVNPLTQFNPNFTDIDSIMKAIADASVDHATCIKTGTVHAVTRTNTDASVFRFTATGNWNTGDTMTVDGTLVSVFSPDGTSPLSGCFVINTEVIAAIQGTRVTLYVASSSADKVYYDNANTVKDKIDDIENDIDSINTRIGSYADYTITSNSPNVTITRQLGKVKNKIFFFSCVFTVSSSGVTSPLTTFAPPMVTFETQCVNTSTGEIIALYVNDSGTVVSRGSIPIPAGYSYAMSGCYMVD